jgi:hypothetical protein
MGEARGWHLQADLLHRRLEAVAVLGRRDGVGPGPDDLHAVALEHARLDQLHGEVQRRLATQRGEQGVGPLLLDDRREDRGIERLDVRAVGRTGVGHDGGRIGVGQDDPVPLFHQHPAGLRA